MRTINSPFVTPEAAAFSPSRRSDTDSRTFATAADALDYYNMNWIAEQHSLVTGNGIDVKSHKALVRNDTQAIIGIVGKDYMPIQNNDAFGMFDVLARKHGARWNRAVSLYGGSKIYLQATVGTGEVRKGDIVENRLTIFNAFDGSGSYQLFNTPFRLVCLNGMKAAVASAAIRIRIRHTKNAMLRYEDALKVFGIAQREFTTFMDTSRALAQKMLDRDKVIRLIRETFEVPAEQTNEEIAPAKRDKMNQVYSLFQQGKGNQGQSAYDFVNGVTEFVDHYSGRAGDQQDVFSMIGAGAKLKERAMDLATAELRR